MDEVIKAREMMAKADMLSRTFFFKACGNFVKQSSPRDNEKSKTELAKWQVMLFWW